MISYSIVAMSAFDHDYRSYCLVDVLELVLSYVRATGCKNGVHFYA